MKDIKEIRKNIDDIDDRMLELFLQRMSFVEEIAEYKKGVVVPIQDKEREREILSKITAKAGDREMYAHRLFTTLIQLSKARQAELVGTPSRLREQIEKSFKTETAMFPRTGTVACQGVEGGNSQAACDKFFPRGNIVYVKTFEAVFDAVGSGLCKFGVVPIENSSTGSVRSVYELLQKKHFSIVRSTKICIRHELLAKPGVKLSDIKEIYSHEQAIVQCSVYLSKLYGVKIIPCGNTALAAKIAAESADPGVAAISSGRCAALYGLESLSDDIQDSDNNYTRFICITKDPVIYDSANRISLIVACDNKPGALYDILSKPASIGVNMSKLESCPVVGRDFEFIFFIDLDASVREPGVIPMLSELEQSSASLAFLGNYSEE